MAGNNPITSVTNTLQSQIRILRPLKGWERGVLMHQGGGIPGGKSYPLRGKWKEMREEFFEGGLGRQAPFGIQTNK